MLVCHQIPDATPWDPTVVTIWQSDKPGLSRVHSILIRGSLAMFHRAKPDSRPASVAFPSAKELPLRPSSGALARGLEHAASAAGQRLAQRAPPSPPSPANEPSVAGLAVTHVSATLDTCAKRVCASGGNVNECTETLSLTASAPRVLPTKAARPRPASGPAIRRPPAMPQAAVDNASRRPAPRCGVRVQPSSTTPSTQPPLGWAYRSSGLAGIPDGGRLHLLAVHRVAKHHYVFMPSTRGRYTPFAATSDNGPSDVRPGAIDAGAGTILDSDTAEQVVAKLSSRFPQAVPSNLAATSYGGSYTGPVDTRPRRVRTILVSNGSVLDAARPIFDQCRERAFNLRASAKDVRDARAIKSSHQSTPQLRAYQQQRKLVVDTLATCCAKQSHVASHSLVPTRLNHARTEQGTLAWGHPGARRYLNEEGHLHAPKRSLGQPQATASFLRRPASAPLLRT